MITDAVPSGVNAALMAIGLGEGWRYLLLSLACSVVLIINSRQDAGLNSQGVAVFEQGIAVLVLLVMIVKAVVAAWWVQFAVSAAVLAVELWLVRRWWFPRKS